MYSRKIAIAVIVMLTIALMAATPTGCKKKAEPEETATEQTGKKAAKSVEELESEAAKREEEQQAQAEKLTEQVEPTQNDQAPDRSRIAVIETNKGVIKFGFFPNKAPKTVDNFVKLANEGFYNGIKWHRVVDGFVIQGGDPLSKDADPKNDGTGGPGYMIPAEFSDLRHLEGTVAMARSADPNSAGSQFYICLAPQPSLDDKYTIFGQVTEGLDVVHSIQLGDVMNKVSIVSGQ